MFAFLGEITFNAAHSYLSGPRTIIPSDNLDVCDSGLCSEFSCPEVLLWP